MPIYPDLIGDWCLPDPERMRYWFDFRLLPPVSDPLRATMLTALRNYVTNAMTDYQIPFGSSPPLDEIEPDADGWRTLPPAE